MLRGERKGGGWEEGGRTGARMDRFRAEKGNNGRCEQEGGGGVGGGGATPQIALLPMSPAALDYYTGFAFQLDVYASFNKTKI